MVPSYTYLKLKMPGPRGVITIAGNFKSAYECERQAVEQTERALILDEARLDVEIKCRMSSGTSRCALLSLEHQTTPATPAYYPSSFCRRLHQRYPRPRTRSRKQNWRKKGMIRPWATALGSRPKASSTPSAIKARDGREQAKGARQQPKLSYVVYTPSFYLFSLSQIY